MMTALSLSHTHTHTHTHTRARARARARTHARIHTERESINYLEDNKLLEECQSGFKAKHSCETAF